RRVSASPPRQPPPAKRCTICTVKPRLFEKSSKKLALCTQCRQAVCEACIESDVCFSCVFAHRKLRHQSLGSSSETATVASASLVETPVVVQSHREAGRAATASAAAARRPSKWDDVAQPQTTKHVTDLGYVTAMYPNV
ncbi:hypothetical protein As57867_004981, partial [Aphanomyces stellatus]